MNAKKTMKITAIVLASAIGLVILILGGYVAYVAIQFYRIPDMTTLKTENARTQSVSAETEYEIVSYNLGFGAYSPEYTFFMDVGIMNDGTEVVGKYAKGISKADVEKNVAGQLAVVKELNPDFCFFQEVDEKADRSYGINMLERAKKALDGHCSVYAENFHTADLFYPLNDPIGRTNAGILTMSRYKVDKAVRRSFPITSSFIDKLFDLDRCFAVQYLPIENSDKKLVLINLHMSAYDEGGTIRAKQLEMLNGVLAEERSAGNYVIAGGDFNHCLIADRFDSDAQALAYFESCQKTPDWVKNSVLHQAEIASGFTIAANINASTCRGADMPYEKGVTYSTVIDGFLVSDNVTIIEERTVDTDYAYSDHNPVIMRFKLNSRQSAE